MPAETISSSQNSSYFSNITQDPNYFMICINEPTRIQLWTVYSAFCLLLGFPATLKVLQELCQRRRQNISNDFFVFNLTVIDLVFLGFLPFNIANYRVWHNFLFENICNYIYLIALYGRPLFMACVCGEYYFAVVHPIIYMASKRATRIREVIAMTIYLFITCLGGIITLYPWMFASAFASTPLFIALPVIGFCDITVFRALRRKDPSGKTTVHPQKKRALRTIISSFVMTFTVYLPPAVIFSMGHNTQLQNSKLYYCVLGFLAVCFSVSGCVIMPVLYLESIGQFNMRKIVQKVKNTVFCL